MFDTVEDGFGNTWVKCCEECELEVVRPGKVQCSCDTLCGMCKQPLKYYPRVEGRAMSGWACPVCNVDIIK